MLIDSGVGNLTLTPKRPEVKLGACVTYTDDTAAPVKVTLGKPDAQTFTVPASDSGDTHALAAAGTVDVTVQQTTLLGASGSGQIVVDRAPTANPSGSTSSTPSAQQSQPPNRSGSGHRANPRDASGRRHKHGKSSSAAVPRLVIPPGETASPYAVERRLAGSKPLVAGAAPPVATTPAVPIATPTAAPNAAGASPTTAATGQGNTGLGVAIAALLVVGQVVALGRVLVDRRRRHGRNSA